MVTGLNHVTLSVANLDRSLRFYTGLLGFIPRARWSRGAHLTAGDLWLCLNLEDHFPIRTPSPTYDHLAFTTSAADLVTLTARLHQAGVPLWQLNHSEGDSLYPLDPDAHKLELHATSLDSRLASLRANPPQNLVLFDPVPPALP